MDKKKANLKRRRNYEDDKRFEHTRFDPRFKRIANNKPDEADDRFKASEYRFQVQSKVDKTGRPKKRRVTDTSDEEEQYTDVETSEAGSSDDDSEFEGEVDLPQPQAPEVEYTCDSTSRIGVKNLDWDQTTSRDLYVVFDSLKRPEGQILSVKIYLSETGKKILGEEKLKGPQVSTKLKKQRAEKEESYEERIAAQVAKDYELQKLGYYYAVVDCDSVDTADSIYDLDGKCIGRMGLPLDLSFIPEEMTFDEEPISVSTKDNVNLDDYKPEFEDTKPINHTKGSITWDREDVRRTRMLKTANETGKVEDLKDLIASSNDEASSDEEEDCEDEEKGTDKATLWKDILSEVDKKVGFKPKKPELVISWDTTEESKAGSSNGKEKKKGSKKGDATTEDKPTYLSSAILDLLDSDDEGVVTKESVEQPKQRLSAKQKKRERLERKKAERPSTSSIKSDSRFSGLFD